MQLQRSSRCHSPTRARAPQTDQRCFPETGLCIVGPIRAYWERNGGLPVFGFPITAQAEVLVEGTLLQVQWFERDRLEIQPNGLITAGRLGVERLDQLGTPWLQGATAPADQACRTFPETGHQVCGAFAAYWRLDPGLTAVSGGFIAPNSQRVFLYQGNQLYTVGMDGAGLAALDEIELLDTQAVGLPSSVQSLPDGSAAIYRRTVNPATVVGEVALMRATVGGQPTRLSTAGVDAIVDSFWVTRDGQHVLYGTRTSITDEDNRLFSVSTAGGPVVELPGRQPILPPTDEGPPYRTLPDGPMIAYTAFDAATFRSRAPDNRRVLYLVSVARGTGVELASRAPADWNSEIPFVVSVDGSTVAWATPSGPDGVHEVYVTDTTRVRPVLVARLAPGEAVAGSVGLRLATDGSRLIYQVYASGPQGERWGDLFSVQVK